MKFKLTPAFSIFRKTHLFIMMKTFIFLCCFTAFSFSPSTVLSQNSKVKINQNKTLTVDQVFDLIMAQTDYRFIYEEGIFKDLPKVQLKKGTIKANDLLKRSLLNAGFKFKLNSNNTVLIEKKDSKFSEKQNILTGKITDEDSNPLIGVNVLINTNERGTSTDFDGNYSIEVAVGDKISFSYIGFKTQSFVYNNQSELNVTLKEDAASLDQIVIVSNGYQKISKERTTGSYQNVEEKVLDVKVAQNIISKLEGEVAGVLFDSQDGPTVRGISTINANNDPLIVVDGFPISQGLNSINPNDIEKISVLKDAAAASIWGVRAANGVIVIVTKKGNKNSAPTIRFSSNFGITQKDNYNDLNIASTESYIEFEKHKADNEWTRLPSRNNQPPLGKAVETYLKLNAGVISQAQADAIINNLKTVDNRNEFSDLFMGNEIWRQQNLSVSGGGEKHTYRASVTYNVNENQNFYKQNDREEVIINLGNSVEISPKLTLNTSINYNIVNSKNNGLNFDDYQGIDQYQQILDANGNYIAQPQSFAQDFKEQKVAEGYPYNWNYNLKQEFDEKDNRNKQTALRIQAALNYNITDYLSLEGRYQYEYGQTKGVNLFNENTYYVRNLVNRFTVFDADQNSLVSGIPKGEVIQKQFGENEAHTGRFQFNFDKSFNDGLHNISAIGGYEARIVKRNFDTFRKFGYDSRSLIFANIAYGERLRVTPSGSNIFQDPTLFSEDENRYISYYGNAAYTYNKKYTLSGSVRLDDANLFGGSKEYRNIPLYSVGAKWDLYKEDFLIDNEVINRLSLRATYGSNGNVINSTSPFLQATIARDVNTNNSFGFISAVKNPLLRTEKTFVTNLGLDFGLFNNRLSGSIEYYERKSEDLLAPVSITSTLGFNSALINVGEMENKGIDIQLNGRIVDTENFTYISRINASYNKNEVTFVEVPNQTVNTYLRGEPLLDTPLRYLYSYNYVGLDAEGNPLTLNENEELIDVNGNNEAGVSSNISNVDALTYNGTKTPKYYGSWINDFTYKQFNLRVLTTFKAGHVFRNTDVLNYANLRSLFSERYVHSDFDKRWQNPGDENSTNVPRTPTNANDANRIGYNYYVNGNQTVDSASHIRLKEIILGYQIDNKFLKNTGFSQVGIGFQVSNLAVFNFNRWNVDPESFILPTNPTYTFNITATF